MLKAVSEVLKVLNYFIRITISITSNTDVNADLHIYVSVN